MESKSVAYVTKDVLKRIGALETAEFRFNQFLTGEYIDQLDATVKLPVIRAFAHEQSGGPFEDVIRCMIVLPKHGQHAQDEDELGTGIIDMPIEEYLALPVA